MQEVADQGRGIRSRSVGYCGRHMVIKYGPHGKIPGLSGIPGVPQYQALLREDRCGLSEVRQGSGAEDDHVRAESTMAVLAHLSVILWCGSGHPV